MESDAAADPRMISHYEEFYAKRNPSNVYPVEFVVRTLLGTYPNLHIDRSTYRGSKVLDLGFGDGRNMPLLHDQGFEICGVEISDPICDLTATRMKRLGIPVGLKTGSNSHIPYPDGGFDFVLACHACYYVNEGETFADNVKEIARVLRPGGRFIFSVPKNDSYVLAGAEAFGNGHYRIVDDPVGVRNGVIFRAFGSKQEVQHELQGLFKDFDLGVCENDFYGTYERVWIGTCVKIELHSNEAR